MIIISMIYIGLIIFPLSYFVEWLAQIFWNVEWFSKYQRLENGFFVQKPSQ